MDRDDLAALYRGYIACLNRRDWMNLGQFVHRDVSHNGRSFGLDGYRVMLENDVQQIPDLRFDVQVLVANPPWIATRLWFDVTPKGEFLGPTVNGRKVSFAENVFLPLRCGKNSRGMVGDRQAGDRSTAPITEPAASHDARTERRLLFFRLAQ